MLETNHLNPLKCLRKYNCSLYTLLSPFFYSINCQERYDFYLNWDCCIKVPVLFCRHTSYSCIVQNEVPFPSLCPPQISQVPDLWGPQVHLQMSTGCQEQHLGHVANSACGAVRRMDVEQCCWLPFLDSSGMVLDYIASVKGIWVTEKNPEGVLISSLSVSKPKSW